MEHLIFEYMNKIDDSESLTTGMWGVFETGGSIGQDSADALRAWVGGKSGRLIKIFDSAESAKNYAKRLRSTRTAGEKSYYKITYFIKKLSSKDMQHPQVMKMLNN